MKKHLFIIIIILLTTQIYSQTKAIKVLLDDGTERHFPISGTSKITNLTFVEDACDGVTKVTYSGRIYHAIQIGTQCWFKENLNVGTKIVSDGSHTGTQQTSNSIIEKYCYNNDESNCDTYGGLYEWGEAVQYENGASNSTSPSPAFSGNVQGICPTGWHIPTKVEYETLETYVSDQATKLIDENAKSGFTYTNETGFSALFAGYRYYDNGSFLNLGYHTYFWSSTEYSSYNAFTLYLNYTNSAVYFSNHYKDYGFSIRCLKN